MREGMDMVVVEFLDPAIWHARFVLAYGVALISRLIPTGKTLLGCIQRREALLQMEVESEFSNAMTLYISLTLSRFSFSLTTSQYPSSMILMIANVRKRPSS